MTYPARLISIAKWRASLAPRRACCAPTMAMVGRLSRRVSPDVEQRRWRLYRGEWHWIGGLANEERFSTRLTRTRQLSFGLIARAQPDGAPGAPASRQLRNCGECGFCGAEVADQLAIGDGRFSERMSRKQAIRSASLMSGAGGGVTAVG
jgi:hypothetical protein